MVVQDILDVCKSQQLIKIHSMSGQVIVMGCKGVIPHYICNDEVKRIGISIDINTGLYYLTINV